MIFLVWLIFTIFSLFNFSCLLIFSSNFFYIQNFFLHTRLYRIFSVPYLNRIFYCNPKYLFNIFPHFTRWLTRTNATRSTNGEKLNEKYSQLNETIFFFRFHAISKTHEEISPRYLETKTLNVLVAQPVLIAVNFNFPFYTRSPSVVCVCYR